LLVTLLNCCWPLLLLLLLLLAPQVLLQVLGHQRTCALLLLQVLQLRARRLPTAPRPAAS
jgi:hypothetical protein